jgi:(1->4)-alpha-D-glucan 1-alpha-D-glucosylmutase
VPDPRDALGPGARPGRRVPAATYRFQLREGFGFPAVAAQAGYLADLGVTHAYLSPILQAVPGSAHGYDVIDHSRISADLGGEDEFRAMAAELARHGIGIVADVVPNHMAVPAPEYLNAQLWSVLRNGGESACAHWFDVDWDALEGRMLLPVLAGPPGDCTDDFAVSSLSALSGPAAAAALARGGDEPVLRYREHVLPLRPGTADLPLGELLAAQCYRLDSWRTAATELNWRRFFDISSLIAVRTEEPDVFAATHGLLLGLVAEGLIDGLRVDHPDGLADPRRYFEQLATATDGAWVVAEKILASGEELPADWRCAGTTGYDALAAVGAVLTDPAGIAPLSREYAQFTGGPQGFAPVAWTARREVAGQQLAAEVARLARQLRTTGEPLLTRASPEDLRFVLAEMLAAFRVYRAYVVPGLPAPDAAAEQVGTAAARARRRVPGRLHPALEVIAALLLGRALPPGGREPRDRLIISFQQVCAAVQAKGVEDTAMYRWSRLVSANEVGADPDRPAAGTAGFHLIAQRLARDWPATMTTLSTHDTKRQEDVRARLAVIAESPAAWAREVSAWHKRAGQLAGGRLPDPDTEYLLWQTLVGAWPIAADRLAGYLRKAMREATTMTSWTDPDTGYEDAVLGLAGDILADPDLAGRIGAFVTWITPDAAANSLAAKLIQLTMPGVPDVYQGCELAGFSLVDPDNRRPVDFGRRQAMLTALDSTQPDGPPAGAEYPDCPAGPAQASLDAGKLLVCARALRVRRQHPDWFAGGYEPLMARGPAGAHAVAFSRAGQAVTVATRLPAGLRRAGGWQETVLPVAAGRWLDVLTGARYDGGQVRLAELTAALPVALLVRT